MQQLLETLIKEKGLWNDCNGKDAEIFSVEYSDQSNEVLLGFRPKGVSHFKGGYKRFNIWHIDTLREICKAKWGYEEGGTTNFHFKMLCLIESPKEREVYLLTNYY